MIECEVKRRAGSPAKQRSPGDVVPLATHDAKISGRPRPGGTRHAGRAARARGRKTRPQRRPRVLTDSPRPSWRTLAARPPSPGRPCSASTTTPRLMRSASWARADAGLCHRRHRIARLWRRGIGGWLRLHRSRRAGRWHRLDGAHALKGGVMAHARKAIRAAIKSHLSGATSMGTRVHANRLHPFHRCRDAVHQPRDDGRPHRPINGVRAARLHPHRHGRCGHQGQGRGRRR